MTTETIESKIIPILADFIFVLDSSLISISLCPSTVSGVSLFTTKTRIFLVVSMSVDKVDLTDLEVLF